MEVLISTGFDFWGNNATLRKVYSVVCMCKAVNLTIDRKKLKK